MDIIHIIKKTILNFIDVISIYFNNSAKIIPAPITYIVEGINHILAPESYIVGEKLSINADITAAPKNKSIKK